MRTRAALTALFLLFVCSCASSSPYFGNIHPPESPILRVGIGADPASLDPHLAPGAPEEQVLMNLFEGLTEYDPVTLDPVPAVAERWEANQTGTIFRFWLRRNARWSNGRPVTAHDFVYSWRRALDPKTAAENAYLLYYIRNAEAYNTGKVRIRNRLSGKFLKDELGGDLVVAPEELSPKKGEGSADQSLTRYLRRISWEAVPFAPEDVGVRALDDFTLEVETRYPTAFFVKLTMCAIFRPVPREAVERWGKEWTKPEHIVINGPFALAEWVPGSHIRLEKNPLYWDASRVQLSRAIFNLSEDSNTLLNLYKAGELDVLVSGLLPPYYLPLLKTKRDYKSGPYLLSYYLLLNVSRPPLSDWRLRYALNMAIDKEKICSRLLGAGQRPLTTLTPSDFNGTYPRPEGQKYDPEEARRLMVEAGFPEGRGVRLQFLFNTGPLHSRIAEAVQAEWRRAFPRIQVELINQEWQVYVTTVRLQQFDIARRSWTADYNDPASFLTSMLSGNANNNTGWSSPEYDRLIEQANRESDSAKRMQMLAHAEAVLLKDLPIIPIYSSVVNLMIKPYVQGWQANVLDRHPLRFVSID